MFTLVAVLILDRVGRRPLLIVGTPGCVIARAVLGIFFADRSLQHSAPWISLVAMIVYIGSFAFFIARLPETKDRSLEQIAQEMSAGAADGATERCARRAPSANAV